VQAPAALRAVVAVRGARYRRSEERARCRPTPATPALKRVVVVHAMPRELSRHDVPRHHAAFRYGIAPTAGKGARMVD